MCEQFGTCTLEPLQWISAMPLHVFYARLSIHHSLYCVYKKKWLQDDATDDSGIVSGFSASTPVSSLSHIR